MTPSDLKTLDTIGGPDYMDGYISDDDLDIPHGTKPPNPEESDLLPSVVHPSYPFGNPLSTKHPASRPKRPFEPSSRALFEDMVPSGAGVNGFLRWKELGIDGLLPIDEDAEKAAQAESARKMANGAPNQNPPPAQAAQIDGVDRMARQNMEQNEGDEEEEADEEDGEEDEEDEESDHQGSSEDDLPPPIVYAS